MTVAAAVAAKVAVDVSGSLPRPLALRPVAPALGFRALFEGTHLAPPGNPSAGPPLARSALHPAAVRPSPRQSPRPAADRPDDDPLDPLHRHRAALAPPDVATFPPALAAPPQTLPASASDRASPLLRSSLEDLIPALVRRVAWSGDARRGTARLEIGAGELAGATLLVHADGGRVRVRLDVPSGVDASAWQQRIASRLASRNIPTDAVEVA